MRRKSDVHSAMEDDAVLKIALHSHHQENVKNSKISDQLNWQQVCCCFHESHRDCETVNLD